MSVTQFLAVGHNPILEQRAHSIGMSGAQMEKRHYYAVRASLANGSASGDFYPNMPQRFSVAMCPS